MNEFYWVAIVFAISIGIRALQWFVMRSVTPVGGTELEGGQITSELNSLALPEDSEASELGATGIVPGGVSWTEPERRRATIELGNKRFGKGRNE